nr:unnamed protein product [Callosobruchus analis]
MGNDINDLKAAIVALRSEIKLISERERRAYSHDRFIQRRWSTNSYKNEYNFEAFDLSMMTLSTPKTWLVLICLKQYNGIFNQNGRLLVLIFSSVSCLSDRDDMPLVIEDRHHPAISFSISLQNTSNRALCTCSYISAELCGMDTVRTTKPLADRNEQSTPSGARLLCKRERHQAMSKAHPHTSETTVTPYITKELVAPVSPMEKYLVALYPVYARNEFADL